MANHAASSGYFACGVPYTLLGHGARPLVVFQGLTFEHKPPARAMAMLYGFLGDAYTMVNVLPKPGLPHGYTLGEIGNDYATMIREELGEPVDIIAMSTGGSIGLHFAADHRILVRHLVLHSAAHTLSAGARRLQRDAAAQAQQGRWMRAATALVSSLFPGEGIGGMLSRPLVWLAARAMTATAPRDPSDFVRVVEAEDRLAFRDRLGEIAAPTLVVGGTRDPFYSPALFRETAEGIRNAKLVLYEGKGHAPAGRAFRREVRAFLGLA